VAQSGAVCAGMGAGRPDLKLAERRSIWSLGMASRAGVPCAVREISGVPEWWGGRFSDFQIFRKPTLENLICRSG